MLTYTWNQLSLILHLNELFVGTPLKGLKFPVRKFSEPPWTNPELCGKASRSHWWNLAEIWATSKFRISFFHQDCESRTSVYKLAKCCELKSFFLRNKISLLILTSNSRRIPGVSQSCLKKSLHPEMQLRASQISINIVVNWLGVLPLYSSLPYLY